MSKLTKLVSFDTQARARAREESELDQNAEPPWMPLFRAAARKVLRALRRDSRYAVARSVSGLPHRSFYRNLKKIRSDFAQCFQDYRAYRAKIRM